MGTTTHIVLDTRRRDGTSNPLLPPAQFDHLLNSLASNCKTLSVRFHRSHGLPDVISMEVSGRHSHDMENNTWLRRQAEEFAKGYIAALDGMQVANSVP